jgi:hypothetical protein
MLHIDVCTEAGFEKYTLNVVATSQNTEKQILVVSASSYFMT